MALLFLLAFSTAVRAQFTTEPYSLGGVAITGYSGPGGAVVIPGTIGGQTVTAIGGNAFFNNTTIDSVTIPDTVVAIGEGAFEGCTSLTSVTIPDSVDDLEDSAFQHPL